MITWLLCNVLLVSPATEAEDEIKSDAKLLVYTIKQRQGVC